MELNLHDPVQLVSGDQESFCVGMQISCLLQGVCLPFPKLGNTEGRGTGRGGASGVHARLAGSPDH